jgi:outer membrane protein assembly factor BamE (lipoprotein component of BamABCDE complex)
VSRKSYISVFIILMMMCMIVGGCLMTHRSHTYESSGGHPISRSDLDHVEPGVTTKDWVLDTFGSPTRERHFKDDSEILIYERSERTEHEFSLFLIFSTESSEVTKDTLSFEIKDGVVQKYWLD